MMEETSQQREGWVGKRFTFNLNVRLMGAAVGLLLALLIASGTRRLFLSQVSLALPMPGVVTPHSNILPGIPADLFPDQAIQQAAQIVAKRYPDDLQVQIACASMPWPEDSTSPAQSKIQRLRALRSHFGQRASLYANILRYETTAAIRVYHSREQSAFSNDPTPTAGNKTLSTQEARPIDTDAYLAYDQDAAVGERLDPDNAYFPFLRAIGLFGAHKESEALAAIVRASQKSQWREYYQDELKGQWKLQDEVSVNNSALFHSLIAASILFPHYSQIREAARVTTYMAMQAEQAGHPADGLALRKSVVRLGDLMRVQSSSLLGSLVGASLTEAAISRPAGIPFLKIDPHNEMAGKAQQRNQFDAYLQRVGAAQETAFFHASQQAGDDLREIVHQGMAVSTFDKPLKTLFDWWIGDLAILSNICWLLLLGGMARMFLRQPALQAGIPLPTLLRRTLPLCILGGGCVAPTLLAGLSLYFRNVPAETRSGLLLAGLVPLCLMLTLPAREGMRPRRRLYAAGHALILGIVLVGFYFWQVQGIASIAAMRETIFNLSSQNDTVSFFISPSVLWLTPWIPLLLVIIIATLSLASRVPLSVGLARGFRGLMVPLTALLFLVYGGMLLFTVRAEAGVTYGLDRTLEQERQYIAELTGKPWPRSENAQKTEGTP